MSNLLIVWASPSAQASVGSGRGERERRKARQAGCIAARPLLSAARGPGGVGVCFPLFGIHPPPSPGAISCGPPPSLRPLQRHRPVAPHGRTILAALLPLAHHQTRLRGSCLRHHSLRPVKPNFLPPSMPVLPRQWTSSSLSINRSPRQNFLILCLVVSPPRRVGSVATMHGRSMEPTLHPGDDNPWGYLNADLLFLEKLSLRTYSFSRGDVVVFRCNSAPFSFRDF